MVHMNDMTKENDNNDNYGSNNGNSGATAVAGQGTTHMEWMIMSLQG